MQSKKVISIFWDYVEYWSNGTLQEIFSEWQLVSGNMRMSNDGSVMVPIEYHYYNKTLWQTVDTGFKLTIVVHPDGTIDSLPNFSDYYAHWGDQYVATIADSLYFYDDSTFVKTGAKPTPFVPNLGNYSTWYASTDSAFYVVLRDGRTYHTTDRGDTWVTDTVNLPAPIDGYILRNGIHIIFDEEGNVYFSDDFTNFTEIPQIRDSRVFYADGVFWAAQSHRPDFLLRSVDNGQSWDTIFTEGVNGHKYVALMSYKDTIYAKNVYSLSLYKHLCGGAFEICLDKPFLLKHKAVVFHDEVFHSDYHGLCKYNSSTAEWDTLIPHFGKALYRDKNIFYLTQDSLYYSDDLGETWTTSYAPTQPSLGYIMAAVGDTMVLGTSQWENNHLVPRVYYSLDRGQSWEDFGLPSPFFDTAQVLPIVASKDNHFLFFFDSLYLYSDITAAPDVVKPLFVPYDGAYFFDFKDGFLVANKYHIFRISGLDSITELDFGFDETPRIGGIVYDSVDSKVFFGAGKDDDLDIFWASDYFFSESPDDPVETYTACDSLTIGDKTYYESGTYIKEKPEPCAPDTVLKVTIAPPPVTVDTAVEVMAGDTVQGVVIAHDTTFSVVEYGQFGCDSLIRNYSVSVLVAISDASGGSIRLAPNPVAGRLMINLGDFQADLLCIFNAAGQPVYGQQIDSGLLYLDVRRLPKGNYYLMVEQTRSRQRRVATFQKCNCLGAPVFRDKIGIFVPTEAKIFDV